MDNDEGRLVAQVAFLEPLDSDELFALFRCKACRVLVKWESAAELWECGVCGLGMTVDEGQALVENAQQALDVLKTNLVEKGAKPSASAVTVRRDDEWRFPNWFRRLFRLGP